MQNSNTMNQDLMQKLMISKAIMDKHNEIPRGQKDITPSKINVESFDAPQAKYNLPDGILSENTITQPKTKAPNTLDAIKNSKLPDAIKKLMIENPIQQVKPEPVISDELIEKASRLMKNNSNVKLTEQDNTKKNTSNVDIESIVKNAVRETLKEYGLISESSEKANESFSFKV